MSNDDLMAVMGTVKLYVKHSDPRYINVRPQRDAYGIRFFVH